MLSRGRAQRTHHIGNESHARRHSTCCHCSSTVHSLSSWYVYEEKKLKFLNLFSCKWSQESLDNNVILPHTVVCILQHLVICVGLFRQLFALVCFLFFCFSSRTIISIFFKIINSYCLQKGLCGQPFAAVDIGGHTGPFTARL